MKHSNFEHGNVLRMPSKITNPIVWDTVLESVNDQFGQNPPTGPSVPAWIRWKQSRSAVWQRTSGKKFFLTLGTASVLATAISFAAHAEIVSVNQEVYLTGGPPGTAKPLDMDDDGMPDLSCTASVTFDDGRANGEVECIDINGEIVEVGDGICDLPKRDEDSVDDNDQEAGTQVCPEGVARYLAIKTSGDRNAWVKVVMDADRLVAKAVEWGYERCVGFPIEVGQTTGGATCPPTDTEPGIGGDSTTSTTGTGSTSDGTSTPPPTGVTVTADYLDQVTVTWSDTSGEIGYNLYRNGQKIAEIPANVTRYTDYSVTAGTTYVYEVKAVYDSDMESLGVTVTVKTPDGLLPASRLFVELDSSCTGSVTLTIDGHFETSCASSDCQTVRDQNGETVQNCAPNCSLAFDKDDIGKDVKLTPHANSGCVFGSWGGHHDCADDSKILVTRDNKLCIAFFNKKPTPTTKQGNRGEACPDSMVLYVNQSATGAETGCSWTDAVKDLQTAVTWVREGAFSQVKQIWVKGGWSVPDESDQFPFPNGIGLDWDGNLNGLGMFQNYAVLDCDCYPVVAPSSSDPESIVIPTNTCRSMNTTPVGEDVYVVFMKDDLNHQVFCRKDERNVIYLPDSQE